MKKSIQWFAAIALTLSLTLPAYAETSTTSDWETIANVDGFVTKRKSVAGSNVFAFRGETVANVSIGKILKIFLDSSTRKNWVAMYGGSGERNVISPMDYATAADRWLDTWRLGNWLLLRGGSQPHPLSERP